MLAPPSPCTITMATTGINGGTNNSFLQQKHSLEELQEIVKLLSAAIEVGDIEHAKTLTGSLAAARAKVKIDIESVDRIFGDTFPLTVQIEDRQGHSTVKLQVTASDTIRDLKNKFLFKYQFPVEVQRWVVGKKLPPDNETLSQHKIRGPGNTAYVYLVTAKSAMSEPTYQHQQSSSSSQRSLSSGSAYMNMSLPQQSQQSIRPSGQPGSFVRGSSTENPYTNMQNTSNLRASNSQASINDGGYEIFEPLDNSPQAAAVPVFAATVPAAPAAHAPISTSTPVGAVRKTSEEKKKTVGWECPACTYINMPTRPGCEICSTTKPDTYEMPDNYVLTAEELQRIQEEEDIERHMREQEEQERLDRLTALLLTDDIDLIANTEEFVCPVCFDTIDVGDGVVLRECLHNFCRECLMSVAQHTEIAELHCPFQDNTYKCESIIQEREIRALVNDQIYQQILQRSLTTAESQEINSYHCATTDCPGWCIYEDLVNFFLCPVCTKENCLTCKATHEGMNCLQYQNDVRIRATNDSAMKKTKEYLDLMVDQGNAMHCPQCQIIVMKKDGCDWIKCSCCKTEICWVTKGRRWGLNGQGDTSGGCRCNVNGKRCHADCANCH